MILCIRRQPSSSAVVQEWCDKRARPWGNELGKARREAGRAVAIYSQLVSAGQKAQVGNQAADLQIRVETVGDADVRETDLPNERQLEPRLHYRTYVLYARNKVEMIPWMVRRHIRISSSDSHENRRIAHRPATVHVGNRSAPTGDMII